MLDATEDRRIPRRADRRIFCGSNRRPQEGSGGSSFAARGQNAVTNRLALLIKNSFGRRRDFRVKMWGTSSPEDKLTGDLGNVIEPTSIGGRRSDFFAVGKLAPGNLGLLQQYRHKREVLMRAYNVGSPRQSRRDASEPRTRVMTSQAVARQLLGTEFGRDLIDPQLWVRAWKRGSASTVCAFPTRHWRCAVPPPLPWWCASRAPRQRVQRSLHPGHVSELKSFRADVTITNEARSRSCSPRSIRWSCVRAAAQARSPRCEFRRR
jgi:hypothetical protein